MSTAQELHNSLDISMVAWAVWVYPNISEIHPSSHQTRQASRRLFSNTAIAELLEFLRSQSNFHELHRDVSELLAHSALNQHRNTITELLLWSALQTLAGPATAAAAVGPDDD